MNKEDRFWKKYQNLEMYMRNVPIFNSKSRTLNWFRLSRTIKGNCVIEDSTKSIYKNMK